jgi:class 3 adenylate cyclase
LQQIAEWLAGIGLGRYAQIFVDNGIDLDVLPDLREEDLEGLGVLLGHRRKLLRAIANLAVADRSASGEIARPSEAERRQLTVMFCDMVGSMALSSRLDPEDMREVIRLYQDTCAGVVARYDGFVAKFMGDGVLVHFGYPRAHEDDAERAARAARSASSSWARG